MKPGRAMVIKKDAETGLAARQQFGGDMGARVSPDQFAGGPRQGWRVDKKQPRFPVAGLRVDRGHHHPQLDGAAPG